MKTKVCSRCKIKKSIIKFYKNKYHRDGLCSACKICVFLSKKKYYQINKEKIHQERFRYNRSLDGIYYNLKYSAKRRNIEFVLSKEEFINWYNNQEQICYYCNRTLEETKKDKTLNLNSYRLSVDRKDAHKGYSLDNVVLACFSCNMVKGKFFTEQEMLKLGSVLREIFNNR